MARRKKMTFTRFLLIILLVIVVACLTFIYENYIKEETPEPSPQIPVADGQLKVYFIDVGQADATLIIAPTGETMLIDAGKELRSSYPDADDYLLNQNITTLDYLVFTHYDYDHIGSGEKVLEQCEVKNILAYGYEPESATGKNLQEAFTEEGATILAPDKGYTFTMGNVYFEVLSEVITEDNRDKSNENDNSVCLMMTYGDTKFLFTGDGEEDREQELIQNYGTKLDADVFQAGHHGARNANTKELLDIVTPDYAIFSCGTDNSYGHPTAEAMDHIDDYAKYIFRTDLNGTILMTSDGETITYSVEKGEVQTAFIGWMPVLELRRDSLAKAA